MVYRKARRYRRRRPHRRVRRVKRMRRTRSRRWYGRRGRRGMRRGKKYQTIRSMYPKKKWVKQMWTAFQSFQLPDANLNDGLPLELGSDYQYLVNFPFDPMYSTGLGQYSATFDTMLSKLYRNCTVWRADVTVDIKQISVASIDVNLGELKRIPVWFIATLMEKSIIPDPLSLPAVVSDPRYVKRRVWITNDSNLPLVNTRLKLTYRVRDMFPSAGLPDVTSMNSATPYLGALVRMWVFPEARTDVDVGPWFEVKPTIHFYSCFSDMKPVSEFPADARITLP